MEDLPEPTNFSSQELFSKVTDFLLKFKIPVIIVLLGLAMLTFGLFYIKNASNNRNASVEILESPTAVQKPQILVEVAGEVNNPGVYKFEQNSRIDDAIKLAGGLTEKADKIFVEKTLNRAAKLIDGQKIYIPETSKQSQVLSANNSTIYQSASPQNSAENSGLVNINTASISDLDSLPGIGPVYAQKIIDQRPYSNTDELLSKKVVSKSTYEKIKSLISVY